MEFFKHSSMKSCRIICGEKGEGKTTKLLSLYKDGVKGVVSLHENDEYFALNLETKEKTLLLTKKPLFPYSWRAWYYNNEFFSSIYSSLSTINSGDVFIDEVGMMEVEGKGFYSLIKELKNKEIDLTITTRNEFLYRVLSTFSFSSYYLIQLKKQ